MTDTLQPAAPASGAPDAPDAAPSPGLALARFLTRWSRFSGRATRREFWYPVAVLTVVALLFRLVRDVITETATVTQVLDLLASVYLLAILVPVLSLCSRRLHDSGLGAAWLLYALIPVLGQLFVACLMFRRSRPELMREEWRDEGVTEDPVTSLRRYLAVLLVGTGVVTVVAFTAGMNNLYLTHRFGEVTHHVEHAWRFMTVAATTGGLAVLLAVGRYLARTTTA
ncbi:DUF805 domain-containing protein [Corynebacteriaceae bacterium 7-707]